MSKRLRKGDTVLIITGNDRGKSGKILSCLGEKVVVEGINVRKKHVRKSQAAPKGQIIDIERPIHISNVRLAIGDKPVKLRVREKKGGERELYYMESGKAVSYRLAKKSKSE